MKSLFFLLIAATVFATTKAQDNTNNGDLYDLVYKLREHQNTIVTLDFTPDGRYLASGAQDLTVKVWDAERFDAGNASYTLRGHNDSVTAVAFSHDGLYLASADFANHVLVWTMSDPEHTSPLMLAVPCEPDQDGGICYVDDIEFSPVERVLAVYTNWNGLVLYDIPSGVVVHRWEEAFGALAYSADGKYLACGDVRSDLIYLFDAVHYADDPIYAFRSPAQVYSLAFSPDGQTLAAGTGRPVIRSQYTHIFDAGGLSDPNPIYSLDYHSYFVWSLDYSRDGAHLATGSGDSLVVVYGAEEEYERVDVLYDEDDLDRAIYSVVYSDRYLAAAGNDYSIDIYQLRAK